MVDPTADEAERNVDREWLMRRLAERLSDARRMDFIFSAMGLDSTGVGRVFGVSGAKVRESLAYAEGVAREMAEDDPSIIEVVRGLGRERVEFW